MAAFRANSWSVTPPLGFGRIEAAQLFDWDGDSSDAEYQNLLKAIEGHLGPPQGSAPEPAPVVEAESPSPVAVEKTVTVETEPQPAPSAPPRRKLWAYIGFALAAVVIVLFAFKMFRGGAVSDPHKPKVEASGQTRPHADPGSQTTPQVDSSGQKDKWGLTTPAFIIAASAWETEKQARGQRDELRAKGYQAGYLWIPDYESLSGAKRFVAFVGPFATRAACKKQLAVYRKVNPDAYGVLVAHKPGRVEVR